MSFPGLQISSLVVFSLLSAGVPQGAILSSLLFILYTNDLPAATVGNVNMFADDTSAFVTSKDPIELQVRLQNVSSQISDWFRKWLMTVNTKSG